MTAEIFRSPPREDATADLSSPAPTIVIARTPGLDPGDAAIQRNAGAPRSLGSPRPFGARDDGVGSDGSRRQCPDWELRPPGKSGRKTLKTLNSAPGKAGLAGAAPGARTRPYRQDGDPGSAGHDTRPDDPRRRNGLLIVPAAGQVTSGTEPENRTATGGRPECRRASAVPSRRRRPSWSRRPWPSDRRSNGSASRNPNRRRGP